MGYMRHHGILVTTFSEERAREAHATAKTLGLSVSDAVPSPVNCYVSFAVFPDGSKEGWAESDAGDGKRNAFIAWLDAQRYEDDSTPFDWVEVQYGDGDCDTRVTRDSDARVRAALPAPPETPDTAAPMPQIEVPMDIQCGDHVKTAAMTEHDLVVGRSDPAARPRRPGRAGRPARPGEDRPGGRAGGRERRPEGGGWASGPEGAGRRLRSSWRFPCVGTETLGRNCHHWSLADPWRTKIDDRKSLILKAIVMIVTIVTYFRKSGEDFVGPP